MQATKVSQTLLKLPFLPDRTAQGFRLFSRVFHQGGTAVRMSQPPFSLCGPSVATPTPSPDHLTRAKGHTGPETKTNWGSVRWRAARGNFE